MRRRTGHAALKRSDRALPRVRPAGAARPARRDRRARSGFTLLEVMLALALTAVLLVLIATAIDLHLRMLDDRRAAVEQAQLARAIMRQIADDLRSTLQPSVSAGDFSGVSGLAADSLGAAGGSDLAELGDLGDLSGAADDLGLLGDADEASATSDIASSQTLPPTPGLYGNQFELQVDISRLPRVDEFQRLVNPELPGAIQDIPSAVKTVAYYVRDSSILDNAPTSPALAGEPTGGLVRRVLDRAVTICAQQNGNLSSLDNLGQVVAPEVTYIEFQYYDGMEWLPEWDSEEQGGLPVAVHISLALATAPTNGSPLQSIMMSGSATAAPTEKIVSLTVPLLTGSPCEDEEAVDSGGMDALGL